MKRGNIMRVPYRRKREGRTHYKKRLKIVSSHKVRLVVRRSLRSINASFIEYSPKGDKVILTVNSRSLEKMGWKADSGNLPSAYLTGMLAGKKAMEKGIKNAILDLGLSNSTKGSRIYATLAGVIDAGLLIPVNEEVLPSKDRITGEHISKYAASLKDDEQKYQKQFSGYIKKGIKPEDMVKNFNDVKGKING